MWTDRNFYLRLFVLGGLFVCVLAAIDGLHGTYWDFRNNAWAPTRLVWRGEAPADHAALDRLAAQINEPLIRGIWVPSIMLVAAPLGGLPWETAAYLWFVFNVGALVGTLYLVLQPAERHPTRLLVTMVLLLLFPATISVLLMGQVSLMITALTLLTLRLLLIGRTVLAGALLSLCLIKPQLVFLVLPLVLAWLWRQGRLLRFGAGVAGALTLQGIALTVWRPDWLTSYVSALASNPDWFHPNLLSWLNLRFLPAYGEVLWSLLVLAVLIVLVRYGRRHLWEAGLWALALTPFLTPYSWSYDLVLLLPLLVHVLRAPAVDASFLLGGFLLLSLLFRLQKSVLRSLEQDYVWVAPLLLLLLGVAWRQHRGGARRGRLLPAVGLRRLGVRAEE